MRFQGLNREFVDSLDDCGDTHGAEGIKKHELDAYGILRSISVCNITVPTARHGRSGPGQVGKLNDCLVLLTCLLLWRQGLMMQTRQILNCVFQTCLKPEILLPWPPDSSLWHHGLVSCFWLLLSWMGGAKRWLMKWERSVENRTEWGETLGTPGVSPWRSSCGRVLPLLPLPCCCHRSYVTLTSLCIYLLKTQNTVTPAFDPVRKAHGQLFS